MSLTVKEMLEADFFQEFKILAGRGGVDNQIQGVAILDAPDGFNWTKGREMVISSGYIFERHPTLLTEYMKTDVFKEISALGLKMDRYIKSLPQEVLDEFDRLKIPLIRIPSHPSWMEIVNEMTVLVMNKNIMRFSIGNISPYNLTDLSYQERKINKILSQIEEQLHFPAMVYDISKEKAYYSSDNFQEIMYDMQLEDLWEPSMEVSSHLLCDNLRMTRYRVHDDRYEAPYSWIKVPIIVGSKLRAYFVIVEAAGLIDYFEQFTLRIGFLLLQSLFEQILVVQTIGDLGFERFVEDILSDNLLEEDLPKRAQDLGLDVRGDYYLVLMREEKREGQLLDYKGELRQIVSSSISNSKARMAMVDENNCLFLLPRDSRFSLEEELKREMESTKILHRRIEKKIKGSELLFSISDEPSSIFDLKRNFAKAKRTLDVGRLIFPERNYLRYSQLGIFAWLDIEEDDYRMVTQGIEKLLQEPQGQDLLEILKVYLQSNMNYSLTAKKMYIHINTIRSRLEQIRDMIDVDLENPLSRLMLEALLLIISPEKKSID